MTNRVPIKRLLELSSLVGTNGLFYIEKEPHTHNDGTDHFTHIFQGVGDQKVLIADYLTDEMAEYLCLLYNNSGSLINSWVQSHHIN